MNMLSTHLANHVTIISQAEKRRPFAPAPFAIPIQKACEEASEPMNQQKRRTIAAVLFGMLLHRVHGMAEMAPGDAIHSRLRGTRC